MKHTRLRLVRRDERAPEVPEVDKGEQPCGWCAFIVVFLFMGCLWWPIFKLIGAL